jgi:mRNA interferase MazF
VSNIQPGDVVTFDFPGATGVKRRPMVVVSSDVYHAERPDVILGVLTSNLASATSSSDYVLQDWKAAGLHLPSAFRAYLGMASVNDVQRIGHLSARDWQAVRERLRAALA